MKRNIKKTFPLILAIMMICALAQSVLAESVSGTVTYDGNEVDLSYSTQDINARLASLTPGDEVDLEFILNNDSSDNTDWYVQDSVVKAFEDNSAAEDGAYTYSLSYTGPSGNTTEIYSSEVGGRNADTTIPAGLKQATSGDEEYYYLDQLAPGKKGTFRLSIAIDGETLGNDYQASIADLDVNFAVEVPDTTDTMVTTRPKTGDYSHLAAYIALFAIAAVLLAGTGIYALHTKRKGDSDE